MDDAAEAAVTCLGIVETDRVLVVFNAEQRAIAAALAAATRRAGAVSVEELAFAPTGRHGAEPPPNVAAAMAAADAVFAPTSWSLSQTQARITATQRGVRVATMPTITEDIFRRAIRVDYEQLHRVGERVAGLLTAASTARVTSAAGTDIDLDLRGRTALNDDGLLRARGAFGNLPAGEAYIAPNERAGTGTVVIDGSLAGHGRLASPLRLFVRDGRITDGEGGAAEWLLAALGEEGRSIAELGIGTNPAATVTGNVLEDEKAVGTMHMAFGSSAGLGGVVQADVHIDGIILEPALELDGDPLLL